MRKVKIILIAFLSLGVIFIITSSLKGSRALREINLINNSSNITLTSKEDTTPINFESDESDLLEMGFIKSLESDELVLYLQKEIFNIAIYDKNNGYIWFGFYPKYLENGYTKTVKSFIESGVTIDYFDGASLNEARMSLTNSDGGGEVSYQVIDNKLNASINFKKLGISFKVLVYLDGGSLYFEVPREEIVEIPYKTAAMKVAKEYKLQDIILFPYFGSNNYEINGYAFIPDGSGALIRYRDEVFNSPYIRRIYGRDFGIQTEETTKPHLKEGKPLSTPIFGINHGYHQAAFLAEINSGYGASELHSYPYMYNQINLNTTFFVYKVRDSSLIKLSGGSINTIPLINKEPYPADYQARYTFLQADKASYVGMALTYKEHLNLEIKDNLNYNLNLEIVGQDSKPYLFGEKKVKLTSYLDALSILTDLSNHNIDVIANYKSYSKNGTYGKNPFKFQLSHKLGGRKDFKKLIDEVEDLEGIHLSLEALPLLVNQTGSFERLLKKTTLDLFKYDIKASYQDKGSLLSVDGISKRILKNKKQYVKYQINSLNLDYVGNINFSYRSGKKLVYREEMIKEIKEQLNNLADYSLGLNNPASYTFSYIDRYYNASFGANEYAYISESVPFISILLSGSVSLYSAPLNYTDNLDYAVLKMIEYNINPSFIVTKEEGHHLRYTNYEYLFSTEYNLWKETIYDVYQKVGAFLSLVDDEVISDHKVVLEGLSEIVYQTKLIYVNYSNQELTYKTVTIPPFSAVLVEVDS